MNGKLEAEKTFSEKTKDEIILENLPLVKKVASKIYYKLPDCDIEFDDLVNTGIIGLIKAIDKYKEGKAKFSTYAYIKIRGEILDYLRSLEIVPRSVKDKIKREKEENDSEQHIPLSNTAVIVSIDKAMSDDDDGYRLVDRLVSKRKTPEEEVIELDINEKLMAAINKLNDNEKAVLQMIYFEERDLKYISKKLNISMSRISQIKSQAVTKLKSLLLI
jgi:RNA polymerase sigma factor for flagellar operon FliA